MKALTVCQPYAYYIATAAKRVENRTWATSYRGRLAIHAGKSRAGLAPTNQSPGEIARLTFGAVIAIVDLVDCIRLTNLYETGEPHHLRWVIAHEYTRGPWCWVVDNVRLIEPVPARGLQRLWDFDATGVKYAC